MGRIVGIDFGTSNSSVAFHDGKSAQIIEMQDGSRMLPSVLTFDENNDPLVGFPAIAAGKNAPLRSMRHIKRLMGARFVSGENMGPQIVRDDNGMVAIKGPEKNYPPSSIAAVIIGAMLDAVEAKFDEKADGVVIGVPAGYKEPQRAAIREAVVKAGIAPERVWTLEESKAAAIMYAAQRKKYSTIAVYDWGGGTFDFTILRSKDGKIDEVGTRGNPFLGGKDVDELIVRHVLRVWKERYDVDLGVRETTMPRIRDQAEATKIELTGRDEAAVRVDFVDTMGADGFRHMNEPITKAEFEDLARKTVEATFEPCRALMAEHGIKPEQLDEVILVGGMTRVPLVREMVTAEFKRKPLTKISPEDAVAMGLATYAATVLERRGGEEDFVIRGKATHSIALETIGDIPYKVITRGSDLPAKRTVKLTTDVDDQDVVSIHVLEGDNDKASGNTLLKRYYPPVGKMPATKPTIEVEVERKADGAIIVTDVTNNAVIYKSAA